MDQCTLVVFFFAPSLGCRVTLMASRNLMQVAFVSSLGYHSKTGRTPTWRPFSTSARQVPCP